jgi:hypothetical protein
MFHLNLLMLLSYVVFLFLSLRMYEIMTSQRYRSSPEVTQELQASSLPVPLLRAILEERGVSYEGVLEKTELFDIALKSGECTSFCV